MKRDCRLLPLILPLIIIVVFALPWFVVHYVGMEEIHNVASQIAVNASDQRSVVDNVVNWQRNNLFDLWDEEPQPYLGPYFRVSRYPYIWLRYSDSSWVMFFQHKYGKCGEYARIFADFLNATNFRNMHARIIYNLGEDHTWNEAWVDGRWIHVDSIVDNPNTGIRGIVDDSGVYERSVAENGRGQNLLFVYTVDEEGRSHDVTNRYIENSKLSKLTVLVKEGNEPAKEADVLVEAISTGETVNAPFRTGENGTLVFDLTENENYKIIARSRGAIEYHQAETIVYVGDNSKNQITLIFTSPPILTCGGQLIFLGLVTVLSLTVILVFIKLFSLLKKHSPIRDVKIWKNLSKKSTKISLHNTVSILTTIVAFSLIALVISLIYWEMILIIIGSIIFGFSVMGVVKSYAKFQNDLVLLSGVMVAIATILSGFVAYISSSANLIWALLWYITALLGLLSAIMIFLMKSFSLILFGTLGMAVTSLFTWSPLRSLGFLFVPPVIILSLVSAGLVSISRRDFSQ